MNADVLLEHFHRLGDAPDAVPRLRRFILDLAVRGKLVGQSKKDESVDHLLNRTRQEMLRLVANKELKAAVPLENIDEDVVPFKVPQGWRIVRMGWLAAKLGAGSTPLGGKSVYQDEGVPFLRSQNVHDDGLRLDDVALIPHAIHERMSGTHVQRNDILLNITGASIGRCALVPDNFKEGNVSQHVAIIRLFDPTLREFIHLSLRSPFFQKVIDDVQVGVSREGLSMQGLKKFPMLIPPLPEQHRIVAKVDELMALCDRLEAAQQRREQHRTHLTAATWQGLVSETEPETTQFALAQLPALTTRKEQIAALRQTILDLAVRGRLVKQDERDEPAEVLLKRMAAERVKLVEAREFKRTQPLLSVGPDERPFEIPAGWSWTRLGVIGDWGSGSTPSRGKAEYYGGAYTWLKSGELNDVIGLTGSDERVSDIALKECSFRLNRKDDVLIAMYGATIGKLAILGEDAVTNQAVCGCTVLSGIVNKYLFLQLLAMRSAFHSQSEGGAQPNISKEKIVNTPFPLPPLPEQHRIVAKVDELMALCDRLEAALEKREATKAKLLEALLHVETSSAPPPPQLRQHPATTKTKPQQATYPEPEDALPLAAEPVPQRRGPGRPRKAETQDLGTVAAAITGFLQAHPGWHARSAIVAGAGIVASAWNAAINALLEAGKVERQGAKKGARYRVTASVIGTKAH